MSEETISMERESMIVFPFFPLMKKEVEVLRPPMFA